ncbi:GAF domain-containing protein, partial [Patulibacter sp. NPDC049589]|uniref:GAF domain-containing protein n=1 Tax=Patulibacter sp. NPDC049589 TaxID=3154731 RepID=UPI00342096E0
MATIETLRTPSPTPTAAPATARGRALDRSGGPVRVAAVTTAPAAPSAPVARTTSAAPANLAGPATPTALATPAAPPERRAAHAFGELLGTHGDAGDDDLLRAAAERLCALLVGDRCSAYVRNPATGAYLGRAAHPVTLERVLRRLSLADDDAAGIAGTRWPRRLPDGARTGGHVAAGLRSTGAVLAVPLPAGDRTVGLLLVEDRDRRRGFADDQVAVAAAFARLLGAQLARRQDGAELEHARIALASERRSLRRLAASERRFATLADGTPGALLAAAAEATAQAVELRDADGALVGRAAPERT